MDTIETHWIAIQPGRIATLTGCLTVPLLLVELILVMKLARGETISKSVWLGGAAALMIILEYPGEVADTAGVRFTFWVLSMIPFLYTSSNQLVIGLTWLD